MALYKFSSLAITNHSSFLQFRRDIQVMIECLFIVLGHEHKSRAFSTGNSQLCDGSKERPYSCFNTVGKWWSKHSRRVGPNPPSLHMLTLLPLPSPLPPATLKAFREEVTEGLYSTPTQSKCPKTRSLEILETLEALRYRCPFSGPLVSPCKTVQCTTPGASFQRPP